MALSLNNSIVAPFVGNMRLLSSSSSSSSSSFFLSFFPFAARLHDVRQLSATRHRANLPREIASLSGN